MEYTQHELFELFVAGVTMGTAITVSPGVDLTKDAAVRFSYEATLAQIKAKRKDKSHGR